MKNLRKLTAAVLVVALVLTSMTTAFAADSAPLANADKAVTLKDLGLYSGQDANDPKVGLENALTTQDSLIFLAKLFGYYDTATKLTPDQVGEALAKFDDAASISDYAKNIVAYSTTNNILSGSTQNDKLFVGAKDTVTAARFATFMLRQMGYTVPDYRESIAQLAETRGSKVEAAITGDLTRDAAVGIMYGALTAERASGKTVIADITGDNVDLKTKAEKLGLIGPEAKKDQDSGAKRELGDDDSIDEPENVIIEEAQLIAKNKIKLIFNKKMGNVDVNDIEITTSTTSSSIKVSHCESTNINYYGKTEAVLILDMYLSTDARDDEGNEIFITTIAAPSSEAESGSKLRSKFSTTLKDKTPPEIGMWDHDNDKSTENIPKFVADIGSTGIIILFFSEDINETTLTKDTFKITGFKITSITAYDGPKTVTLTVEADGNPPANITVTQDLDIYDVAGNKLVRGSTWEFNNTPTN